MPPRKPPPPPGGLPVPPANLPGPADGDGEAALSAARSPPGELSQAPGKPPLPPRFRPEVPGLPPLPAKLDDAGQLAAFTPRTEGRQGAQVSRLLVFCAEA